MGMEYVGTLTAEAVREDGADRLRDDDLMDMGVVIARHTQRRVQIVEGLPRGCRIDRSTQGLSVRYTATGWAHEPVTVFLGTRPGDVQVSAALAAGNTVTAEEALVLSALVELAALEGVEHDERTERARR